MRIVFALMSVVGMLVAGTYAIRDASERSKMRVRCVASSRIGTGIEEKDAPELPSAFKWWAEDDKSGGSRRSGGDKEDEREKATGSEVTDGGRSGGVLPVASGAAGERAAASDERELVLKPGSISPGGVGIEEAGGEDAAQIRQINRQLTKMRQQIRRRLEVAMRNARIPADARQDIRMFMGQLFRRIAEVRRQAALGQIPRYQMRQEMRAAWQDFTGYVNDRLDAEHRKQFWREWQYAKNPQKRFYDMQRQMQDIQKKVNRQSKQMQRLMRRPSHRGGRQHGR